MRKRKESQLEQRLRVARGNAVPGGRISSSGAVGSPDSMVEANRDKKFKSDGRPSWVGRSRFS